jgi:uncharacterized protein with PIN domain
MEPKGRISLYIIFASYGPVLFNRLHIWKHIMWGMPQMKRCPDCGRPVYPRRRPHPRDVYYTLDYKDFWECRCGWSEEMVRSG